MDEAQKKERKVWVTHAVSGLPALETKLNNLAASGYQTFRIFRTDVGDYEIIAFDPVEIGRTQAARMQEMLAAMPVPGVASGFGG